MTDDPMDDPMLVWGELYAPILRAGPRLDARFPPCPVCFLPPSWAENIGGVTWCYCENCKTRFHASENIIDPASDDELYAFMLTLAECIDLDPAPEIPSALSITTATIPTGDLTMTNPTTATPLYLDPWAASPRFTGRSTDPLDVPPSRWEILQGRELEGAPGVTLAAALGGFIVSHLAALQGRRDSALEHRIWNAARVHPQIELMLSRVPFSHPTAVIEDACRRLLGYGNLLSALRARRDALDRQIAVLEARRGERAVAS